jgi:hypothetical protein
MLGSGHYHYQHAEHFDLTEIDLYLMCRSPVDNPMLFQNHFSIPPERR